MQKKIINILLFTSLLVSLSVPFLSKAVNPSAVMNLSYNDGIECYLNNRLVISALNEAHPQQYWNRQTDISNFLVPGQNLLACRIGNGDGNSGSAQGYFDLELTINSQTIISRGSSNWKYFGQGHVTTPPYADFNGKNWYDPNYNDSSWQSGSMPFDGGHSGILTQAPDDAWFRKSFNVDSSYFGYISNPPPSVYNCSYFTNQTDCFSHNCYWTGYYCQSNPTGCATFKNINNCISGGCYWNGFSCLTSQTPAFNPNGCFKPNIRRFGQYSLIPAGTTNVLLNTPRPLITGLVKYNSKVNVYVDETLLGEAIVQEGELTGVSNFYFKPQGNMVSPDTFLFPHKLNIVATNLFDQSICNNDDLTFQITPYPSPIIHRLGEITYVFRADNLTIKTKNPMITGLTKYGSEVYVYVDDKLIGRATVKDGQKSGVANFYLQLPNLSLGNHTIYTVAKKINEEIYSPNSQTLNFTIR